MNAAEILGTGLGWLWRTTWQASVLVLLVLLAQWLFRARLTPGWRHALWWLVLIRLLLPVVPASPFSIFNLARVETVDKEGTRFESVLGRQPRNAGPADAQGGLPRGPEPGAPDAPVESALPRTDSSATPAVRATATSPRARSAALPAEYALWGAFGLWLAGVVFLGARLILGNWGFARRLRRRFPITDSALLNLLEECRHATRVRSSPALIEAPDVDSPALFGCFRVKLLLPPKVLRTFSPTELRHVFLHELSHVRRGDVPANWLMALVQIAHWFNPVIWFAFSRMRVDRELACDALALSVVKEQENQRYGQTIVKLLEGFVRPAAVPGLVGILETPHQMKRRMSMIAKFKKANRWPVVAVAAFAGLGLIALTDAQTEAESSRSPTGQPSLVEPKLRALFTTVTTVAGANDGITTADWLVLSPNGRFLNWQGRVVPLDGSQPFSLTDRRVWGESWAPNGRLIACSGLDGLYVIPVDAETGRATGPSKKLVSERLSLWGDQRLHWTPDSERILFAAWDEGHTRLVAKSVSVNGGNASDAPDWSELGLRSPDGKTIAYSPRGDGIWVRPVAGGQAKNLSASGPFKRCEPLAWSTDGQWIIGHAGPGEGGDEVRLIRFPDDQEFRIPVPESVGVFVGKSPNGDQIFFYRVSYELAFVPKVVSILGGTPVSLSARQPGLSFQGGSRVAVTTAWAGGMPYSYDWLEDGQGLVVTTVKADAESRSIGRWIYSFTGEEPVELKLDLPQPNQEEDGLLAPNGGRLLFSSSAGGSPAWYLVPLALREGRSTGLPVKLCDGGDDGAAWSPDGTRLAIIRDNEIWTVSDTIDNWNQLTKTTVPKRDVAWSPDGSMLAYYAYEPGKVELCVVPASGGEAKSIHVSNRQPMRFLLWAWSPDSKSITMPEDKVLWQRSVAGNAEQQLLNLEDMGFAGVAWLAWSPDGHKLAFEATGSLTEQDTFFVWDIRGGQPQKLDAPALGATHFAFAWSRDSQRLAYTSLERPKTRLEGTLSRLDVGEALKLAASGAIPASTSTNQQVHFSAASTNAVPIINSRFTDNFDTGISPCWTFWEDPTKETPHEHAVKNGELVLENTRAILDGADWTNYVVRARIRLESAPVEGEGVAGFCVRRTPDNPRNPDSFSRYNLVLVCSGGEPTSVYLGILYHDPSGQMQHGRLDLRRPALSLNQWYTLELEVKGRQLRGFLDGQLVAEGVDDRLTQGGIHLNSWNTRVRFDDFSVQLLP
ncbi:MAG: PD40 domain-containing protein [Verrucomicrobia bacterium]|nr:PD40 domain-containing protein [Verrucomicrobiota bacterium]